MRRLQVRLVNRVASQHRKGVHRKGVTRVPSMRYGNVLVCLNHGMLNDGCHIKVNWEVPSSSRVWV